MDIEELIPKLMTSIADERLAILAGAGLSMAAPTNTPSAAIVAHKAVARHLELTGQQLPAEIEWDLEKVAKHFHGEGQLSYFLNRLVDWVPFRANPNRGHLAIADFLACGAIDLAITTNFDELVESAARRIGEGDFRAALDGGEANQKRIHEPYLKIYGCCVRDVENTVWCVEQTTANPLAERLGKSTAFLSGRLLNRDLLVVGFWSDWSYLNAILQAALPAAANSVIYLVDPASDDDLKAKAPALWAWAEQHLFEHVRAGAGETLEALRRRFSELLLRRVMMRAGNQANVMWLEGLSTDDAYAIRRDLAGVDNVARERNDDASMSLFARSHQELNARGGVFEQGRYTVGEKRIRVVQAAGRNLSDVRADFTRTASPTDDLDVVVCAGAQDDGNATENVVRDESPATIMRAGTANINFVTSVAELFPTEGS